MRKSYDYSLQKGTSSQWRTKEIPKKRKKDTASSPLHN